MDSKVVAVALLLTLFLITPTPLITSVNPDNGLNNGTVDVVISGDKIEKNAQVKLAKPGEPEIIASDIKVISKKEINCSFDLRGYAAGKWSVIVVNPSRFSKKTKTAVLAGAFLIQYPAPTISAVDPNQGLNSHNVAVNITGDGFRAGARVVLQSRAQTIEATEVKVIAATRIFTKFGFTGAEPGMYDVKVINDDGKTGILEKGFIIGNPAPEVTLVMPNRGENTGVITVMITGSNFRKGAGVTLNNGKETIDAVETEVVSGTQISSKLKLTGASPGTYDVKVTNDDGQSGLLTGGFRIEYPAPAIARVEPRQGLNTETVTVNLYGANFRTGIKVELRAEDRSIQATDVRVVSDTQVSAILNLTDAVPGVYDVKVTNDDGKSGLLTGGFRIEYPAPAIARVEPRQGLNTKTVTVNLYGANFRTGIKVELRAEDRSIQATDVRVVSDTQVSAILNLTDAVPGVYDVKVTNDDGQSGLLTGGFRIEYPAPAVVRVEPRQGLNTETVTVNLYGANFRTGIKVELRAGDGSIRATDIRVVSDTQVSAIINLTDAVPGVYDVKVTNDDGQSGLLTGGFQIIVKPGISGIIPDEGFNNGSLLTEIHGTNFESGVSVKLVGPGNVEIPGLNVKVKNSQLISCFFDLNKKPTGSYDVIVTSLNGQKSVLPGGFEVKVYIPTHRELNDLLKPVFFDFDRFEIRANQIPALDEDVKILNKNPNLYILLGGHADERGTREYNLDLSEKRAVAIKQFLIAKGIDPSKISIYAYGKDYPVKKGHDETSWWFNRRVDIIVWESVPTREQGLININSGEGEDGVKEINDKT